MSILAANNLIKTYNTESINIILLKSIENIKQIIHICDQHNPSLYFSIEK